MKDENKVFPKIAKDGIQVYVDYIGKRYSLTDQILQSIKEGNEFRTINLFRARTELSIPGRLDDELTEAK